MNNGKTHQLIFFVQTLLLLSQSQEQLLQSEIPSSRQLQGCASGLYLSGSTCVPCSTGCESCTSANDCSGCLTNYFKTGNTCTTCGQGCRNCSPTLGCSACGSGYVLNISTCLQCSTGCEDCNLQGCVKCKLDYTLAHKACTYDTTANPGGGSLGGGAIAGIVIGSVICVVCIIAIYFCLKKKFLDDDEKKVHPTNNSYCQNQSFSMGRAQPMDQHTDYQGNREPSPYMAANKRGVVGRTENWQSMENESLDESGYQQQAYSKQSTRRNPAGLSNQPQGQGGNRQGGRGQQQGNNPQGRNQQNNQPQRKNSNESGNGENGWDLVNDIMFKM